MTWNRQLLKSQAKQNLQNKYWLALVVTLLVGFLGGAGGNSGVAFNFSGGIFSQGNPVNDTFNQFWQSGGGGLAAILLTLAGLIGMLGVAYQIFVAPVIQVGAKRWFSRSRELPEAPSIGQIFSLFKAGRYLKTVGSMLWMNLFLFLWGLLAAIPLLGGLIWAFIELILNRTSFAGPGMHRYRFGFDYNPNWALLLSSLGIITLLFCLFSVPAIIKSYSYRLTPWILADNPTVGYDRALKISIALTRGYKWKLFVLDLSFIGWMVLGLLACGIGIIFVTPYVWATQAEAYAFLRQAGVESGACSMVELGFRRIGSEPAESSL